MGEIIQSWNVEDYEVLTDTGFENIKSIHKTIPYEIVTIKTKTKKINCSFNHLFFDDDCKKKYVYDFNIGDLIMTKTGLEKIIDIKINSELLENMWDLELEEEGNRRYYTNNILSHNTGMGKTSSMCGLAANFLREGHDVLYITLEMAEEKIAQRIEANFLNIDINDIPLIKKNTYSKKLLSIKEKTKGRLVIKEYPPAYISVSNIRFLLDELKVKLKFDPKIIILDYINLLNSDRIKSDNMYSVIKSITEEVRGLAVELKKCILSATQGNRQTQDENNSDIDLTNVSESVGLNNTVDALIGVIMPNDLREQNIQIWKILKNRFGGVVNHKIPLKVNFARAGIYDNTESEINIVGNNSSNTIKLKTEENRLRTKNKIIVKNENSLDIENDLNDLLS